MEIDHLTKCPYVGLQPFSIEDEKYFFGRERDSRIISSNLFAFPLTVFYGSSGVGKSSILQAGVIPLLEKTPKTAVISFQQWPEKNLLHILKSKCLETINAKIEKNKLEVDWTLSFDEFLFQAQQDFQGNIIFILDQFEEYFLYHLPEENTFDAEFARAINRREIDAHFLVALREDSLYMLDRFRARIPNMLSNPLRLHHLDATSAEDAIRKPLGIYNQEHPDKLINIEDSLVKALIQEARIGKLSVSKSGSGKAEDINSSNSSDTRIETPFLQLILSRLWNEEMKQGSHTLQLETLKKLGGASNVVQMHLDHVMNELPAKEQEIASNIFLYLVTPSGTKIAYTVEDLAIYYNHEKPSQVQVTGEVLSTVLENLAKRHVRILQRVTLPNEPIRYEIYHDVLAPAILDWRIRYEKNKEIAKVRETDRNQVTSLLKWAALGAFIDFIWTIFSLATGFFFGSPILSLSVIIPMGAFSFGRSLRRSKPPLQEEQINKIIHWWFGIRVPLSLVGILFYFLSTLFTDSKNIAEQIIEITLIGVGVSTFLISGPLGGLWAYWRIRRKEN